MGINAYGLSRSLVQSLPPPAPDFRWRVVMPPQYGNLSNGTPIVVEGISWPFVQIDARPRFGGGTNKHYPEWNNVGAFSVTFYETNSFDATNYLLNWLNTIVRSDGSYGLPADYKQPISLYMYGWNNDTSPIWQDTLIGCWPSTQGSLDLNYTSEGRLTVSGQFNVDGKQLTSTMSGFVGAQSSANTSQQSQPVQLNTSQNPTTVTNTAGNFS